MARLLISLAALCAVSGVKAQGVLEQMQDEVAAIVSRARPAIVSIEDERVFTGQRSHPDHPGSGHPDTQKPDHEHDRPDSGFPRRMGEPPKIGSGFSIGGGYIVTTADVLSEMKNPVVRTEDGRRLHARITGFDAEMNIGVLRIEGAAWLPALKLGSSHGVYPGHFAISIGNQYGHINSVALTLVAGLREDGIPAGEHFYPSLIQIAGTVGVGTSGAPILNARGDVIGMIAGIPFGDWTSSPFLNSPGVGPQPGRGPQPGTVVDVAVPPAPGPQDVPGAAATTGGPEPRMVFLRPPVTSAGFALPIDDMKPVMAALRNGKMQHCWLGVDMAEERTPQTENGFTVLKRSVRVSTVYPSSPASGAGVQSGDVIVAVNGRPVARLWNIRAALLRAQPGESMEVSVERKGARQSLNLRLVGRPETAPIGGTAKH